MPEKCKNACINLLHVHLPLVLELMWGGLHICLVRGSLEQSHALQVRGSLEQSHALQVRRGLEQFHARGGPE